jgi:hypothetical protein
LSSIPSSHRQGKSAGWIQALGTPVSLWPERVRIAAALGAMVLCATVAYFSIQPAFIFAVPDADNYQRLSIGDTSRMMQPFASRQMGALVVHALMRGLHISSYAAWYLEAEIAGAALLAVVYGLMAKTAVPRWMLLALVVVPFWSGQMQYLVMPDLWYSGLLAIMFLLMARRQMLSAALMMFPLMFSRESTTLTLLCFLVAAWSSLRWRDRIAAVLSAGAGTLLVGHLARNSGANVEHLPEMVYILAKVPWNFVRNVIGFEPWSNVNPELCNVPRWSVPLAIGPLRAVGICRFAISGPLVALQAVMTQFGLLPLLAAFLWWRHRRFAGRSPLLRFTLLYGAASFLLGPMLGNWILHLVGYGWPLFLVALPLLFNEFAATPRSIKQMLAGVGFFAAHLCVCAAAHWQAWLPQIGLELVLWAVGFVLLRVWWGEGEGLTTTETATA